MRDWGSRHVDELIETVWDEELATGQWVYVCKVCGRLYTSKPIPCRTIFEWYGYHPGDGNFALVNPSAVSLQHTAKMLPGHFECHMTPITTAEAFKDAVWNFMAPVHKEEHTNA